MAYGNPPTIKSFRRSLKFHGRCKHLVTWMYAQGHQTFAFDMKLWRASEGL